MRARSSSVPVYATSLTAPTACGMCTSAGLTLARECSLPEIVPAIVYTLCVDALRALPSAASAPALAPLSEAERAHILNRSGHLRDFHDETAHLAAADLCGDACGACGLALQAYWARMLHFPDGAPPWLARRLNKMLGEVPKGVCPDCCAMHYDLVYARLAALEDLFAR